MSQHIRVGQEGERLALQFLQKQGYDIIARNFQGHAGEIDIIAYDKEFLVFIEVKTRTSVEYGRPADAVDKEKQKALHGAAGEFRAAYNMQGHPYRFDIVSILLAKQKPQIILYQNAIAE
ncbi:MAG: YraN family protein [Acidobacteria bacterium]|nr:YraN family protein [Acidobacteriota bacterium]MBI3656761.1 YraN family protein [Acidobacteriota bacterium]